MKLDFQNGKLILRFTISFIMHQVFLMLVVAFPGIFVFWKPSAMVHSQLLAVFSLVLYLAYCLFYGFYVAKPMADIIVLIKKLSKGEYLSLPKNEKLFSNKLYREVFDNLNQLSYHLQETERRREEFEEMRRKWASGITHDLKTPLSYIKGYTDMLLTNEYNWNQEEKQDFLTIIQEKTNHLETFINDLEMAFLMEDTHKLSANMQTIDMIEFIEQIIIEVKKMPHQEKTSFEFDFVEKNIFLSGDKSLLKRAFINIYTNAIIHNEEAIEIETSIKSEVEGITIYISDNGKGVDKHSLKHLFDRYYRGTTTESDTNATGLGMAITKQIIELHHGTITVSSQLNEYTKFQLFLPYST
ncbi:sensor histidine kinase [Enterococcus malodoratus]|uniref:sensor histidine kinase n=1 Tax=Enterococcus malodoratus TaxID=71451 RepID=UPI0020743A7E|nr:HAMP domain-containing sensor histidine kinase [Enterococcus malodoratus]